MPPRKQKSDPEEMAQVVADAQRYRAERELSYREQALKIFPHVCARCGREFSGKRLRELTVHHKDSDHMNNQPDGSNWELLCLSYHDNEHETPVERDHYEGAPPGALNEPTLSFRSFEGLKGLATPEDGEQRKMPRAQCVCWTARKGRICLTAVFRARRSRSSSLTVWRETPTASARPAMGSP